LVVLSLGATEQHGPYLPTGTDIMVSSHVAELAATRAVERGSVPIILAPPLAFGISDHHRDYGGTLSVGSHTMLAVLEDLIESLESQGGRRLLMVNGHGGNRGIARAAASAADARESITIAAVDYWDVDADASPGHAGSIETSLLLAIAPELVKTPIPTRERVPEIPSIGRASYHGSWLWRSIDGYTDEPSVATAEDGHRLIDTFADGLADMMVAFGKLPA
jgi:creatinine amidohydrolase